MSGHAKRGFNHFISKEMSKFYKIIKNCILPVLPADYVFSDIWEWLEVYYPFELREFKFNLDTYAHQDRTLKRKFGKKRYCVKPISVYLRQPPIANLLSNEYIQKRKLTFDENERYNKEVKLKKKRNCKIEKRKQKIDEAKKRAQEVEPEFLDKMLGLYDKKATTQKDRVYILHEIYKYDCAKVTEFLRKALVHEQNFQLREMALKHLQDYGYNPILRGKDTIPFHSKNKNKKKLNKEYRNLRFEIDGVPEELSYQIENSTVQKLKNYDFFISHSCADHDKVQEIIFSLNRNGINVYCDWISDADYLKRELVCEATLEVIKKRITESNEVLFVDSENSRQSQWVALELQYARKLNKQIRTLHIDERFAIGNDIPLLHSEWYNSVHVENIF